MAAYRAQTTSYNNQVAVNEQKILTSENEIVNLKDISSRIENTEKQISSLVNTYINLDSCSDFRGKNEDKFFDMQDDIVDDIQNYLNKTEDIVISVIADEITYKKQEIASLNSQILMFETLKANLRIPRCSDIEEISDLKDNMQSVQEELENLKNATNQIVAAEDFSGEIADSFKTFFQEVHYMAIDMLSICLNDAENALEKLKRGAINVDASDSARIDVDYLDDIKHSKLLIFKNKILFCDNEIEEQISICNSLNLRSCIRKVSTDNIEIAIEDALEYLEDAIDKIEVLSGSDFSAVLESDLSRLFKILEYMSNIVTSDGVSVYAAGNVCKQNWYTDVLSMIEEHRTQLLEELNNKLDEEYKQGLIDQITWENLKYILLEYGPTTGVAMLTKMSMKKVAVAIPGLIKQGTTLFMNRGLVAALAGGGEYLITESPTFLTSVARGVVKYGTPIAYGVFEFARLKASGQDTVAAGVKAVGHTASVMAGMAVGAKVGGVIGSSIPIPIVGTVAGAIVGGIIGAVGSFAVDWIYDNKEKIAETVGNFACDIKNNVCEVASNVKEGIGNAISGLFSGVANVFS